MQIALDLQFLRLRKKAIQREVTPRTRHTTRCPCYKGSNRTLDIWGPWRVLGLTLVVLLNKRTQSLWVGLRPHRTALEARITLPFKLCAVLKSKSKKKACAGVSLLEFKLQLVPTMPLARSRCGAKSGFRGLPRSSWTAVAKRSGDTAFARARAERTNATCRPARRRALVAQIDNLPYRRMAFGRPPYQPHPRLVQIACRPIIPCDRESRNSNPGFLASL